MRDRALEYLRVALAQPDAQFREGQWESIEALLSGRRLLVVQRTGWGKSMVYFLATRLLRDSGAGVSLLISPLLALVRNQLEAAARIGVRAESINSTNMPEWRLIEQGLRKHAIDILLISPERLANDKFRENVLSHVAEHVGLFIVDEAYGILLHGEEDERITDFFIRSAFPPQRHVEVILETLDNADEGLSVRELEARLNLRHGQIEKALKYLSVESPSPVTKIGPKWNVTAVAETYRINQEYVESISAIRRHEQAQMAQYLEHGGCLMEYLERALDDPAARPCGRCAGCNGAPLLSLKYNHDLANRANIFLKRSYQRLEPRRQWPSGGALPTYEFSGRIGDDLRAEEGQALCLWRDAGWGQMVATGKYDLNRFDDKLVSACVEMIRLWDPQPAPAWIACIPSLNRPKLVADFAVRLGEALGIPCYSDALMKVRANEEQKNMQNSFQQAHNLNGVFELHPEFKPCGPCFLLDDITDSGWTFTVAAALLRRGGCAAVFPLALALNSPRMD